MTDFPWLVRSVTRSGEARYRLGDPLVDRYLEFVAGRARPNTLRAVAFDLKAFFTVVAKDPVAVAAADVFEFLADQRGDRSVVRLADRESGLSARTIACRLSSVSGLYAYLVARGDTPVQVNPVPRGLSTRRQGGSRTSRTVPLVRVPRTLPKILAPAEVDRLLGAPFPGDDLVLSPAMATIHGGDQRAAAVAYGHGWYKPARAGPASCWTRRRTSLNDCSSSSRPYRSCRPRLYQRSARACERAYSLPNRYPPGSQARRSRIGLDPPEPASPNGSTLATSVPREHAAPCAS